MAYRNHTSETVRILGTSSLTGILGGAGYEFWTDPNPNEGFESELFEAVGASFLGLVVALGIGSALALMASTRDYN